MLNGASLRYRYGSSADKEVRHNPLGKVFSASELRAIGNLCVRHDIMILSDEVYERIVFDDNFPRMALQSEAIAKQTLSVGSVGKSFNATGWRVGYVIGPKELIQYVQWAHAMLAYVTSGPAQEAAAVGFESSSCVEFWKENQRLIKSRVTLFCQAMDELGLEVRPLVSPMRIQVLRTLQCLRPSAAYFVFVDMSRVRLPTDLQIPRDTRTKPQDWQLCWFMINVIGISCIPGSGK